MNILGALTINLCLLIVGKLMEMHGDSSSHTTTVDETGTKIERDGFEPPIQESV